jgi:hypothetical protein
MATQVTPLVANGTCMGVVKEFGADEVGINGVSVKAAATVAGNIINVHGFKEFMISVAIDNTGGGATGLASLRIDTYDEAGVAMLTSLDLVTAMNLKADNTVTVSFGFGNTAKHHYTSGTPLLSSNADILRGIARMKCSIVTTEVSNGTTVTAIVRVRAQA